MRAEGTWTQIWVTELATRPGGVKEKHEVVSETTDSRIRFQGRIRVDASSSVLDCTTLSRETGGRVRQVIEMSEDEGATWTTGFDASYRPAAR